MEFAAIFAMIVGAGMIFQWAMSYLTKQIPELKTEPIRIWFHIAAEMITAVCLLVSGIAILNAAAWGLTLYLIALGMLFYTAIVSPGYFAQQGKWGWLMMFTGIILLGMLSLVFMLYISDGYRYKFIARISHKAPLSTYKAIESVILDCAAACLGR